ncbi:reverse transcriptase domain-containing protein [Acinetobacter rudis]|uniref:Reverse transcriptase domain-containing protein n=1 Tax=Acinetobacter rudis CIP 110305 TaxID=421052 RepID=S3MVP4_9GAMM|nr:reverse transcriptase domain-containing protein [Acinetobacter rudis]EPF71572.1 hypothetical protein F945_02605 [Acinetobacter rudis CIP 110305]
MDLNISHVEKAYLYLKNYVYHENLNLFLKQRIASFEESKSENMNGIFETILNVIKTEDHHFVENEILEAWLQEIDYHLLPKAIGRAEEERQKEYNKGNNGVFISNVKDSLNYQVSNVNYFIKAPIEIHIIEILWCLFVGPALENILNKDCYGNRLHQSILKYGSHSDSISGQELFKRYIVQYNSWRDQAIKIASNTAKTGEDVALLSLDLKSYYYHIDIDFDEISDEIRKFYADKIELLEVALKLNKLLEKIFNHYRDIISPQIKRTHERCENKSGIPIGFASSAIIANWYLLNFDEYISDRVRPQYYGRYVDDIIMVFRRPKINSVDPIEFFIRDYLDDIIKKDINDDNYIITIKDNDLPIQKDKLILQFYDKDHSQAGLDLFKNKLDERSSAFKFLPSDHLEKELDLFAYDILYDGSANALRSVIGLAENETGLSKYLSSHISAHRLCKTNHEDTVIPQLKKIFKGKNALSFFGLWEKIYQYGIIIKNFEFIKYFNKYINLEIERIIGIIPIDKKASLPFSEKLKSDLKLYNELSLALTIGLLDIREFPKENGLFFILNQESAFLKPNQFKLNLIDYGSNSHKFSWQFRKANLIRHHLVAWPLANFCNYEGDLTCEKTFLNEPIPSLVELKIKYSPRFIHFDEWQLLHLGDALGKNIELNKWFNDSIKEYTNRSHSTNFPVELLTDEKNNIHPNIIKSHLKVGERNHYEFITLAIANLEIKESDIAAAIRKDKRPNLNYNRQEKLYNILNSALKEKSDLLIMPEVAIPVSWLPFMIAFSRRHQIGLVFGLEHWVNNNVAYNLIIEALPFKFSGEYKSCAVSARIKNHYAPSELDLLESLRIKPGNLEIYPKAYYHKTSWRGISFTTYNCFELSDITHRVLFKSEIDLLIACVWNKDTNYYQHILESSVRDLHCYTVQANTSQYGGSCILRPTETARKTLLYVKGGENSCVLTTKLCIKELRDFQFKSKPNTKDMFKHLPPGYDCESVLNR